MRGTRQTQRGLASRRGSSGTKFNLIQLIGVATFSMAAIGILCLLNIQNEYIHVPELTSIGTTITTGGTKSATSRKYPIVDCTKQVLMRNDDPKDPNRGMAESPKRLTITNPPFWISLHKQHFDNLRWGSIMLKGNYYEMGINDQFQQILANTTHPGLVVDIGLNIGWFSLWSRAHGHRVAGFEPNPIMHTRVCESLQLNDWDQDDSVQIFPYGLGDQESIMNLNTGKNPGKSSFLDGRVHRKALKEIEVKVATLDVIAEQEGWLDPVTGPTIHLMKVDVEGYEPFVFRGGNKLLHSGKVENIIMENSVTELRTVVDLIATIYNAGYDIKLISTVNGDPYHTEMLPRLAKELPTIQKGMPIDTDQKNIPESIQFFATVTCNIWWTKRV